MMISPMILAVVIAVFAGLAFTGGFAVSDWRSALQIQRLGSDNAMLSAANDKCATDIQSVHSAMDALTANSARREKNAAKAMRGAEADAAKHTNRATKMRSLPSVKPEHEYEILIKEQIEYVQNRHNNQ
ncbi:hypothetical protein [Nitrosovibrio tenuis]|uniref:Bacteriophage Rz lysis protein n=1 Tax=Nitrosovibrio tenuis TaxID=1233 RepID=A0A1H7INV0_9PROT|nr:hypothetical protein [Nitrosovibrio tenuis]SEK63984.1 hypothetical protein SAMN05216387_102242 [Nitrosovibrio tenuis]